MAAATRIRVPATARRGEIVELRAIIMHPMENGFRMETNGEYVPVHIIHTFVCRYNGTEVFRARLEPGIAANPYLAFTTVATESGTIEFVWLDDDGTFEVAAATIEVT